MAAAGRTQKALPISLSRAKNLACIMKFFCCNTEWTGEAKGKAARGEEQSVAGKRASYASLFDHQLG